MSIQFSAKEAPAYFRSVIEGISARANNKPLVGLAREVHDDLAKDSGRAFSPSGQSLLVPLETMCRTLYATGSFTAAGALVGSEQTPAETILRPASVVLQSGAEIIFAGKSVQWGDIASHTANGADSVSASKVGNLSLPMETSWVTFEWLDETENYTPTNPAVGSLNMTPHRVSGGTSISSQLAAGGFAAEYLMRSLALGVGSAIDRAALVGLGSGGEPIGIFNQSTVATVTFSGAATLAKVLDFQTQIANVDADDNAIAWIAHPNIRAKWRALQRHTGSSLTLWSCDSDTINARPARVSTRCSTTLGVIAGVFRHMKIALWGASAPVELIINPYTQARAGIIEFTANALCDTGANRPTAFCRAADSAVA